MARGALVTGLIVLGAIGGTDPARAGCAPPPPPITELDLRRFYADKAGSIVDPALAAEHKTETAPLIGFVRTVTQDADRAYRTRANPAGPAACAVSWLAAWARAGALLGLMRTDQAESERKWDMTGLALAYIKLKPYAAPADRAAIEPWLMKVADASRAFFDDPNHKRNNHWYWLGLGLGAVGIATESPRHWEMARSIMQDAARDIAADGSLPFEMKREARALHYHVFAAMPLVVLAELGRSKGEDWYALNGAALHRLVALTRAGLADPAVFDGLSGFAQERPVKVGAGWLPLYNQHFSDHPGPAIDMPSGHRWLGGDALILGQVLRR